VRLRILLSASLLALLLFGSLYGQKAFRQYQGQEYEDFPLPPDWQEKTEFTFGRLMYHGIPRREYRPGSTLFVVWQQARQSDLGAGGFRLGRDARGIFGVPPHNVFLVKLAYWLNA